MHTVAMCIIRSKLTVDDTARVSNRVGVARSQSPAECCRWICRDGPVREEKCSVGILSVTGVCLLARQDWHVLCNGVAEDGPENTDVIAAAVAQSDHRLRVPLVSDTQTRSKVLVIRARIPSQVDALSASYANLASPRSNPTALARASHGLRPIDFPPESQVYTHLFCASPTVLPKKEKARLSLGSIVVDAHVAVEEGNVTHMHC